MSITTCRCCLKDGEEMKDLNRSYTVAGEKITYSSLLLDIFNLYVCKQSELYKHYICKECSLRVADGAAFRRQVVDVTLSMQQKGVGEDDFDDHISCELDEQPGGGGAGWSGGDSDHYDDEGSVMFIKLEPQEPAPSPSPAPYPNTKQTSTKKVRKKKKEKTKTSPSRPVPLQELKENSVQLILNSNLTLFRSLKTKYQCFKCKQTSFNMTELREHTKLHTNNSYIELAIARLKGLSFKNVDISSLSCKLCEAPCNDLVDLRKHLTDNHNIKFHNTDHFLIPYRLEKDFKCVLCDESFNNFMRLAVHMNSHYKYNVCEICGASFINRLSLRIHITSIHKEKKCTLCSMSFVSNYNKFVHMKKVHNAYPQGRCKRYCLICNKTFRYTYLLQEHKIKEHGVKRPSSVCQQCGKTFTTPQNLKIHVRGVHVRERNYPCGVCSMRFFTKFDKTRHERTHEEGKAFSCGFCSGKFKSKDSWRRHLKRLHRQMYTD